MALPRAQVDAREVALAAEKLRAWALREISSYEVALSVTPSLSQTIKDLEAANLLLDWLDRFEEQEKRRLIDGRGD